LAPARRAAGLAGGALASWLIFNVSFCAWHLPALYDATLRSPPVHALEHFTFFATALLFWTRVIASPPWRSPLSEPVKIAYLASTLVVGWVLAIVLALATSPLYSAYSAEASRPGQISALTDQQLAAGVMWVPGSFAYTIAIVLIAYRLLEPPQARRGGTSTKPLPTGAG
jgi:cytochrome c oxidase assembly factor CtaG